VIYFCWDLPANFVNPEPNIKDGLSFSENKLFNVILDLFDTISGKFVAFKLLPLVLFRSLPLAFLFF
jgi:hypothetical protein